MMLMRIKFCLYEATLKCKSVKFHDLFSFYMLVISKLIFWLLGRRFEMEPNIEAKEDIFREGNELFQILIDRSREENLNQQTTSKAHK